MLALAIGSIQLMLDRGQTKDWFSSIEICLEAALGLFFGYLFVVHTLTARRPFIDIGMFKDRNFLTGSIFGFFLGTVLFGVLALLPTMLETLMGYPVVLTGLVTAPRGIGTLISMIVVGRLIKTVDARILIFIGFAIAAYSLHIMSGFTLGMNERLVIVSGFVQGIGTGLVFVPLTTIAFATLDARYRNEGAATFTLTRNIGSAVGISMLQALTIRNGATVHARLVEGVRPDNPLLPSSFDFDAPAAVAMLNAQITRQAAMVSYVDAFWLLFLLTLAVIPLLLLMRRPRAGGGGDGPTIHMD